MGRGSRGQGKGSGDGGRNGCEEVGLRSGGWEMEESEGGGLKAAVRNGGLGFIDETWVKVLG